MDEPWPRLEPPEFNLHRNQKQNKRKPIWIADDGKTSIEGACEIAKEQAERMNMGNKEVLMVTDITYSVKEKGWYVLVKSRF